ncbi:MAG: hypothetical protein R2761_27420 [Acidimicrobiales bacterium]
MLSVLVMIAVIVGMDALVLRSRFWLRLVVNTVIVAVFAFGFIAFRRSR